MTILSVIQNAVLVTGLSEAPTVVFGSTSREHLELLRLANEMALRISQEYDWQKLSKINTTTANGVLVDFDVPSDFARFENESELWATQYSTNLFRIRSVDDWIERSVTGVGPVIGEWIYYGNQIHIRPAPANATSLLYAYQRNTIVKKDGGTLATRFSTDSDSFELDETLLELGIIWQWKAQKGIAYAEDMQNYELRKSTLIAQDRGKPLLHVGRKRSVRGAQISYPGEIVP